MQIVIIGSVVAILAALFIASYKKAPPNKLYVVTGPGGIKYIQGKAGFVIPFVHRVDALDLSMFSVDVKTGSYVPNNEFIDTKVDGVVKVKIGDSQIMYEKAAVNFLNKDHEYMIEQIKEVLEGNMREIIGKLTLREMVTDRKAFGEEVQKNAVPDLSEMGLEIISFNIQSFEAENDVIQNLGTDNIAKIRKDALISKAKSDSEVAIASSIAQKEANDARVEAEREIAIRDNELAIEKANLKKVSDKEQAIADMTYEIEMQKMRKGQVTAQAEADELKTQRDIEINKNELESQIKNMADAEKYKKEQEATAERYRKEQEAEAYLIERQKEAEAIRVKGVAESEAIRLKGLAEAEAIDKKAEAMRKYGEAAKLEMFLKVAPQIVESASKPLEKIENITLYGDGNISRLTNDITTSAKGILSGIGDAFGVNLQENLAKKWNLEGEAQTKEVQREEKSILEQVIEKLSKGEDVTELVNDLDVDTLINLLDKVPEKYRGMINMVLSNRGLDI